MHLALRADSDRRAWSTSSPSAPRPTKLLSAAVAIAGASVIAINPIAPTLPALQDRNVELAAWVDPIGVWQDTIATTAQNLGTRGTALFTEGLPGAWEIISNSSLYSEIAEAVFNPAPGLEQFFANLSTYSATIKAGLDGSSAGFSEHLTKLPAALETAWEYVKQGQFTLAFASVTSWSIFGLGEFGWPLEPAFKIPGQIARDFGLTRLATVFDEVFVANNAATGYAYSFLSPPITAIYQLTDILNVVSASIYDGDWVTAISEVVNAPAKVLNAFLNGYQPSVAYEWEVFPGVFSEGGPIDALFVKLPKAIAAALAGLDAEEAGDAATTESELAQISSAELVAAGDVVTLDLGAATATNASVTTDTGAGTDPTQPTGEAAPVAGGEDDTSATTPGTVTEDADDAGDAVDEDAADEAESEETDTSTSEEDTTSDDTESDDTNSDDTAADDTDSSDSDSSDSKDAGSTSGGSTSDSGTSKASADKE